jgi:hypothetical protein
MVAAAAGYLRHHPEELVRVVRGVAALRVGVPLAALRWLLARSQGSADGPRDVRIRALPPGLRLSATVTLMGNETRVSATVHVTQVNLDSEQLRVELRLADVFLRILKEVPDSAVATLVKSGALDLSKPGNLAAYMPRRPAVLVEASDDRLVLDLKKHSKLSSSTTLLRALAVVTPVLTVQGIRTDAEHVDVLLQVFPEGFGQAWGAIRRAL